MITLNLVVEDNHLDFNKNNKINNMKHTRLFEQFINEELIIDKIDKKAIFHDQEYMTLSKFLSICKKSSEGKAEIKSDSNFGKGIRMAEHLKKNSKLAFQVKVYRSEWNTGGNLVATISLKGDDTRSFFEFNSNSSTRSPQYMFGEVFKGIKDSAGKPFETHAMYGGFKSISDFKGVMNDVIHSFNDYERVNGTPFDLKSAVKVQKAGQKLRTEWRKASTKIDKIYNEAKDAAEIVSFEISMRSPDLRDNNSVIFFKHDEPRELRHPEEYGERAEAMMSTKAYSKYENAISKVSDLCQKFADKHKIEFIWAASYK